MHKQTLFLVILTLGEYIIVRGTKHQHHNQATHQVVAQGFVNYTHTIRLFTFALFFWGYLFYKLICVKN